ncbi:LysR family transcriptional regulator [Zavarzinia compransoris]|uniref:LysR family transcriptional regulator n=1 Tax=Zavarzinia marina TaxID=2911065 RepID=UPI001F23EAB0|nr:LysR family transcriptional regulator [Zavarzinia marina]MCF4166664.1 LysR family transcriptional regulator [Zavarzinia marina]
MTPWDGVHEFVQVVEIGSFTRAAESLGVSKSFISKQVTDLENRMGVRLLQRTTRQVSLTPEGEVFYRHCKEMADAFERAQSTVSEMQEKPTGLLRIALNNTYGVEFMATAVAEFASTYDKLTVEVVTSSTDSDLVGDANDVIIRYGQQEDSSLYARQIGHQSFCLCATPAYFRKHGKPKNLADLKEHNCLTNRSGYWQFNSAGGTMKVKANGTWRCDDGSGILAAARCGLGLAQLPVVFIRRELRTGQLVALEDEWSFFDRDVWVVYGHKQNLSLKVQLLLNFLGQRFMRAQQRPERLDMISDWEEPED